MSFNLRTYQTEAVDALFGYFTHKSGDPVLALPTGAGKSVIQAAFIKRVLGLWPTERFLLLSHVKELLQQNAEKISLMVPGVGVGIFSAGLGRKDVGYPITVAGIQSVHKQAHRMGDISIVIVDECHLVSKNDDTLYHRFFRELRKFCPHVRIIGMSATPYRLDSGPLIKGDGRIFTDIAHSVSIKDLIAQGHLSPIVSAKTAARADLSGVRLQGGEYVSGELERAMNVDELTSKVLDEVMRICADRASWLTFCVGVDHANTVNAALLARGISSAVVTGDTLPLQRAKHLADFKACRLRSLVSVGVLTTGFDAPNADALICLRPTMSTGLWVQMVGRISRTAVGKRDGLVLDFTSNTRTHGPIDLVEVDTDGNPRTSPMFECEKCGNDTFRKEATCTSCGHVRGRPCPQCQSTVPMGTRECACGFAFEPIGGRKIEHTARAEGGSLISVEDQTASETVAAWVPKRHIKPGKPDSVVVEYDVGALAGPRREWVCFEHEGYAGTKAAMWWVRHGGRSPAPTTVEEAMARWRELARPDELIVRREGKYWTITKTIKRHALTDNGANP